MAVTSCSPTTFFEEVPGYGDAHNSSTMTGFVASPTLSATVPITVSLLHKIATTQVHHHQNIPPILPFSSFPIKKKL